MILCTGCVLKNTPKNEQSTETEDVISQEISDDTADVSAQKRIAENKTSEQESKVEYTTDDKDGFLYNPYDFPLEIEAIKALLGNEIEIKEEYFEGDEYSEGYTQITIIQGDTRISFYDYEGKHEAKITTPKLPLHNGIKIGLDRQDFINAMKFTDEKAKNANIFTLVDDYGAMTFSFRKDTLYLIEGYYAEGD